MLKKVKIIVEKYLKNLYPFISLQSYDSNFKSQNVHFCKENSQILLKKKSRTLSKSKVSANLRYKLRDQKQNDLFQKRNKSPKKIFFNYRMAKINEKFKI